MVYYVTNTPWLSQNPGSLLRTPLQALPEGLRRSLGPQPAAWGRAHLPREAHRQGDPRTSRPRPLPARLGRSRPARPRGGRWGGPMGGIAPAGSSRGLAVHSRGPGASPPSGLGQGPTTASLLRARGPSAPGRGHTQDPAARSGGHPLSGSQTRGPGKSRRPRSLRFPGHPRTASGIRLRDPSPGVELEGRGPRARAAMGGARSVRRR